MMRKKTGLQSKGRAHRLTILRGGPWADEKIGLPAGGTMVFKVDEWRGRYNSLGRWEKVR